MRNGGLSDAQGSNPSPYDQESGETTHVNVRVIRADRRLLTPVPTEDIWLGLFHDVFKNGVTIGTDTRCSVTLRDPSLRPVEAVIFGASNHKLLYRLTSIIDLPLVRERAEQLAEPVRVDYQPFWIGPFLLQFSEITKRRLPRGWFFAVSPIGAPMAQTSEGEVIQLVSERSSGTYKMYVHGWDSAAGQPRATGVPEWYPASIEIDYRRRVAQSETRATLRLQNIEGNEMFLCIVEMRVDKWNTPPALDADQVPDKSIQYLRSRVEVRDIEWESGSKPARRSVHNMRSPTPEEDADYERIVETAKAFLKSFPGTRWSAYLFTH